MTWWAYFFMMERPYLSMTWTLLLRQRPNAAQANDPNFIGSLYA